MRDMHAECPDLVPTAPPAPERIDPFWRAPRSPQTPLYLEKRAQVRVPYEAEVVVYGDRTFCIGSIRNLSERGVSIETDRPLPMRTRVELQLPLLDAQVHVHGEVRWSRPAGGPNPPGMGICFADLHEDEQAALRAFLERLLEAP